MEKTVFVGLLLGIIAIIAVATTGTISAAYTANDDNPSDANKKENFKKHRDWVDNDPDTGDGNPHNDGGQQRAADNLRDNF
jgi:hypothetical protein